MFSSQSKRDGSIPLASLLGMETAHEFNDDTYFTEGGWFSVFFAILYQYGMEAVPDKGREGSLDKSVASAARQKEKKAAYFLMVFTHMLYVAC